MRLLALACAGVVWLGVCAPAHGAGSLASVEAQARAVSQQLASAQAAYSGDLADWQQAQLALARADNALRLAANHLAALSEQLAVASARLARLRLEVARAKALVATDQKKADQGLTVIYEHGTVSFVNVLFGANTFADFLTRLGLLRRIWNLEVGYLRQAEAAQARLLQLESAQRSTVARLADLRVAAAHELAVLRTQDALAAAANARADAAVAAASGVVQQLVAVRNGLEAQIHKLLAELASGKVSWPHILNDIHILASQYGIDPLLVEAVVLQESGGNVHAKSTAGAIGLMQLMPGTAAALGVQNAYNPVQNLRGGITFLLEMLHQFHGNVKLALAAYNAGPYAVKAYGGIPPYQQTQNYVRDVLSIYQRER